MPERKTSEQTDIEWIKQELREIKYELKHLTAFKWKMIGASGLIALLVEAFFHGK